MTPRGRRSPTLYYAAALVAIWAVLSVVWLLQRGDHAALTPAARGAQLFGRKFTPAQGLGPLFNRRSCSGCHGFPSAGGVGRNGLATELRVGRLNGDRFDAMVGRGGPFARAHSVAELGFACDLSAGIPAGANVSSVRNTPPLFGDGAIDAIPAGVIRARAAFERREGVSGRPNIVRDPGGREQVGRFGWKADAATLELFVAGALRGELGVTSTLAPAESLPPHARRCAGESSRPEASDDVVAALTAFVRGLSEPRPRRAEPAGGAVFAQIGCATCHAPALADGAGGEVHLYSDLLLHDMGPALDDRVVQGSASGSEWRTAPLWGLANRTRYLHDGRATSIEAAILAHGGEAARARARYLALPPARRRSLLAFLRTR